MEQLLNPFAQPPSPSFPNFSIMRGDRSPDTYKPGVVVPSIAQLLLCRVEAHVKEAGLKPEQITQDAVQFLQLKEPDPVSVTDVYKGATISATIIKAIYELAPMASGVKVEYFKQIVYGKAKEYIAKLMDSSEPASEAFTYPRINAIFDPYVFRAEKALYLGCATLPQDIKHLVNVVCGSHEHANRDPLILLVKHLTEGPQPILQEIAAPQLLVVALENMPIVKAMYSGELAKGAFVKGDLSLGKLQMRDEAQAQVHFQDHIATFMNKIVPNGLMIYASLVEPECRPALEHVATIEVWPDKVEKRMIEWFGSTIERYRANAAREKNKICLSVMNPIPTVVHEIGHQVEFYLPLAQWLTIQRLLRMRQKGNKLIDIYGNGEEAAIDTTMPAFAFVSQSSGKYVAKVYPSGDTEVVSMTMEYFCQPDKARILINKDPLLALLILRAIRPQDVQAHIPSKLLELLPKI